MGEERDKRGSEGGVRIDAFGFEFEFGLAIFSKKDRQEGISVIHLSVCRRREKKKGSRDLDLHPTKIGLPHQDFCDDKDAYQIDGMGTLVNLSVVP